jgi:hypothetical protein
MKQLQHILLITLFFLFPVSNSFAQKIVKHEYDRFTKDTITETSSVKLINVFGKISPSVFNCQIRKIGDNIYSMPATIKLDKGSFKITEDDGVYFLLENDETIILRTAYTGIGTLRGFSTVYTLSLEDVEKLRQYRIVAIRITYIDGYYDHDIKPENQGKVMKMLQLVDSTK